MSILGSIKITTVSSGWWFQSLWKIWVRQLGWWHSQYMGSHNPNVPVTTNQITTVSCIVGRLWWALRSCRNGLQRQREGLRRLQRPPWSRRPTRAPGSGPLEMTGEISFIWWYSTNVLNFIGYALVMIQPNPSWNVELTPKKKNMCFCWEITTATQL